MEISGQGSATQSTVRQIGSALGTAFAGATLSIALAATLPAALDDAGLTGSAADSLAAATRDSAGTTIPQLRARLKTLKVDELRQLVAHEQGAAGRKPIINMLQARIETLTS